MWVRRDDENVVIGASVFGIHLASVVGFHLQVIGYLRRARAGWHEADPLGALFWR